MSRKNDQSQKDGDRAPAWRILKLYWAAYGGWRALLTSVFLWLGVTLTIFLFPIWQKAGWWEGVTSAVPSLLGFSLGGMAILLAFGDDKFRELTARAGKDHSIFVRTASAFLHFIVVQTVAWIAALACHAWHGPRPDYAPAWLPGFFVPTESVDALKLYTWGFCYFLFVYALLTGIAAAFRVFEFADLYSTYSKAIRKAEIQRKAQAQESAKTSAESPPAEV